MAGLGGGSLGGSGNLCDAGFGAVIGGGCEGIGGWLFGGLLIIGGGMLGISGFGAVTFGLVARSFAAGFCTDNSFADPL